MKFIKIALIVLTSIVALVLIAGAVAPSEYVVKRSVTIDRPIGEVFDYLKLLKNQDNFSAWAKMDSEMKKTFSGTDGTVGFVSAWDSDNPSVGKGEQEIVGIKEGERIDYHLRFIEPFEANDNAHIATESVSANQTKVTWGFDGKMDYPMNLMLLFMDMDAQLGGQLLKGLQNLKGVLEK